MPTCCNCCPKEPCSCGCERPKKDCCRKTVNSLLVENKLHVEGCTKLDNTTQVDKLCFKDNGTDKCRWCIQETSDDKLTITNECSPLTKITLSPDGTVETNGDFVVNGSVKPFRYIRLSKSSDQAATDVGPSGNVVSWQNVVEIGGFTAGPTGDFNTATNIFTVPRDGIYSFSITIDWDSSNTNAYRGLGIVISNVSVPMKLAPATFIPASSLANNTSCLSYSGQFFLLKGDQAAVIAYTGSVTTILKAFSFFEITQLR